MTGKVLEFYFDVGSPTSYLAWTQMPRIAAATKAQVECKPLLLGAVFKATNNTSPALVPAKAIYLLSDLQRFARRYQVPFVYNPNFPINSLELMRMTAGVQLHMPERYLEFTDLLFRRMWVEPLNLGQPEVVAHMLTEAGFNADELFALAGDPQVKERLKAGTDEAIKRGAFGAPTFFVGAKMFFGQDRLDFVEEAASA